MKVYEVTVTIAGTAVMEIEAESKEDAIQIAMDDMTIDDITDWEPIRGEAEDEDE